MNNFRAVNFEEVKKRLDAFAPGMAQAITPIKYEAITPDIFCFLFRTTGKDGQDHYFILFSYDFVPNFNEAVAIIESWHGAKIINFLEPVEGQPRVQNSDPQIQQFAADYQDTYHSLLALVGRPVGDGYWATNIAVLPGDDIDAKLKDLPAADRIAAKKALAGLLNRSDRSGQGSIVEAYQAIAEQPDPSTLVTNDTDLAISLFKNRSGNWEFFYNHTGRTPGDKPA